MKILNAGDPKIGPWWAGQRVECKHCGREVELERDDVNLATWVQYGRDDAAVECGNCAVMVKFSNPNKYGEGIGKL